eukprot:2797035-Amphidinium_carterae.1
MHTQMCIKITTRKLSHYFPCPIPTSYHARLPPHGWCFNAEGDLAKKYLHWLGVPSSICFQSVYILLYV